MNYCICAAYSKCDWHASHALQVQCRNSTCRSHAYVGKGRRILVAYKSNVVYDESWTYYLATAKANINGW